MELKNLLVSSKVVKVEHPELEGFVVELKYIPREKLKKMAERATTTKFSKKTRQPEEQLDNDLFMSMYVEELIKGWTGLKYTYLPELVPVDLEIVNDNLNAELEFSVENALTLMRTSSVFDSWISSIVGDISNFNKSS